MYTKSCICRLLSFLFLNSAHKWMDFINLLKNFFLVLAKNWQRAWHQDTKDILFLVNIQSSYIERKHNALGSQRECIALAQAVTERKGKARTGWRAAIRTLESWTHYSLLSVARGPCMIGEGEWQLLYKRNAHLRYWLSELLKMLQKPVPISSSIKKEVWYPQQSDI